MQGVSYAKEKNGDALTVFFLTKKYLYQVFSFKFVVFIAINYPNYF
jgi:hypothetical protein